MAQSNRLRLREVRAALRLVGECRDLGRNNQAWLTHAMQGLQQILHARVVLSPMASAQGFRLCSQLQILLSVGWETPLQERIAMQYFSEDQHLRDPAFQRFQEIARPNITLPPRRLVSRKVIEASEYHAFRTSLGIDDHLFSQRETANRQATFCFAPQRAPHEPQFNDRELKLLALFHDELALLVGKVLTDGQAEVPTTLSPRLRQTLTILLSGASEKEVARRMGISHHTVHEYVVALYKRFQVNSRAELMVFCHQRQIEGSDRANLRE
jgi:DNA-binding CsgD family transcriptional regulator